MWTIEEERVERRNQIKKHTVMIRVVNFQSELLNPLGYFDHLLLEPLITHKLEPEIRSDRSYSTRNHPKISIKIRIPITNFFAATRIQRI